MWLWKAFFFYYIKNSFALYVVNVVCVVYVVFV